MRGSLWIGKSHGPWNEWTVGERLRAPLIFALVGAVAELLTVHVRLNLGLPGHRSLFWMVPLIALRLSYPFGWGATVGALSAALAAMAAGGQLAGGATYLPMVVVAGMWLDYVIGFTTRKKCRRFGLLFYAGIGGLGANWICFTKRLLDPFIHRGVFAWGNQEFALLTYTLFGFAAGCVGVLIFWLFAPKQTERNES